MRNNGELVGLRSCSTMGRTVEAPEPTGAGDVPPDDHRVLIAGPEGDGIPRWKRVLAGTLEVTGLPLLARIPICLVNVVKALLIPVPIPRCEFFGFGSIDGGFRSWYRKLAPTTAFADDLATLPTRALGWTSGRVIYNNTITYFLWNRFGDRSVCAAGYVLLLAALASCVGVNIDSVTGTMLALLLAGSPLVVAAFTHAGKPEMIWWFLGVPFAALAWGGTGLRPACCGRRWPWRTFPFQSFLV